MAGHVVVGLDLAGSPRRATGGCVLRGLRAETAVLFDDAEIVAFVRSARPALVTIDAPLHLPPGRRTIEDRNGAHFRPCDIALRELGIPFFPITLGPMRMLTVRGIALKKRLARAGFRVLEMYPGGAQDVWNIPRARRDRAGLRSGLGRLGVRGLADGATADELDAASGALVGRLFLLGLARILGDELTGAILLPRPEVKKSASRARTSLGRGSGGPSAGL
jgi:predicted nuclease with RNAse H fold